MKIKLCKLSEFHKAVFISVLVLIFTVVVAVKLLQFRINIPLGNRYMQINTNNSSINIFIPKDDTTWLYIHNLNFPVTIISADTRLKSINKIGIILDQEITPTAVPQPVLLPEPTKEIPKYITSKILGLVFTTPDGVRATYSGLTPRGETIQYWMGYRMEINISKEESNVYCEDTVIGTTYQGYTVVQLANRFDLVFPAEDRNWKRGWVGNRAIKYFSDKKVCLRVYREEDGSVENFFDSILTSARFE